MATSGYIEANGVNYYYEVHGEGEPLLLLHGGMGSIDMFLPALPGAVRAASGDRRRDARPRPDGTRRPQDQHRGHG